MSFNATTSKFSDYVRGLPAATESDLASGNSMPIVRSGDVKKLPAELLTLEFLDTEHYITDAVFRLEQGTWGSQGTAASTQRIRTELIKGEGQSFSLSLDPNFVCIGWRSPNADGSSGSFGAPFDWSVCNNKPVMLAEGYYYSFVVAKNNGSGRPAAESIAPNECVLYDSSQTALIVKHEERIERLEGMPHTLEDMDVHHYITDEVGKITLYQGGWGSSGYSSRSDRLHTDIIVGAGQQLNFILDPNFVCLGYACDSADGKGGLYGQPFNWSVLNKRKVTLQEGKYYVFLVARNNGAGSAASTPLTPDDCALYDFVRNALIVDYEERIEHLENKSASFSKELLNIKTNPQTISSFDLPSGYSAMQDCVTATENKSWSSPALHGNLYAIDKRVARLIFKPFDESSYCEFFVIPPVVSTTGTAVFVSFATNKIQLFKINSSKVATGSVEAQLVNVHYVEGHKYVIELEYDCPNNIARIYDETTGAYDEVKETYTDGNSFTSGNHKGRYGFAMSTGVEVYNLSVYSKYEHPYVMFFGASQNEASYFVEDHTNYVNGQVVSAPASTMRNGYAYKYIDEVLESNHKGLVSGISGTSWNEVYQRLQSEAIPLRPDHVVIMVGNNSWNDSIARQCFELLKSNGIKTLLFNIPSAFLVDGSGGITGNQDFATIATRNGYIDTLRAEYGLEGAKVNVSNSLNNDGAHVDTSLAFYTSGYFPHPNQAGVAKIINRIKLDLPWFK